MAVQELEDQEQDLARRLRDVCTQHGDEKKSKLGESTEILYRMGCLYVRKVELTEGIDQKLNFIKAATLLHGARVRSEKFLNDLLRSEIHAALEDMQTLLIEKCSGNLPVPLLEISHRILSAFQSYRAEELKRLESLDIIGENLPLHEAERKRDEKIFVIKKLLETNSENYKDQMRDIAAACIEIVGPLPCNFAIAGLGSLARNEGTLYSDFEHVIILEEGEQNTEDYEEVLEYFRWFSLVFHVIVIGIGETIIPSVGVDSINNFHSSDKSKNWFYDAITPSGVAFDGMMPHACKNPLGRQIATDEKKHTIELIKPVSEMVFCLTTGEDLKNGYCLKDVLCETCFIYGSDLVYFHFTAVADKILEMEKATADKMAGGDSTAVLVTRDTWMNINPYIGGREHITRDGATVDTKFTFYRPLSILISYAYKHLIRYQHSEEKSGFDKIILLKDQPHFPRWESLLWAFAVACEVRLKVYAESGGNRTHYVGRDFLKCIGLSCLRNCGSAIDELSRFLRALPLHGKVDLDRTAPVKAMLLMCLEDFDGAKEEISNIIEQVKKRHRTVEDNSEKLASLEVVFKVTKSGPTLGLAEDKTDLEEEVVEYKLFLAEMYIKKSQTISGSESQYLLQEAENVLKETENYQECPKILHVLSKVYYSQGRFQDAKEAATASAKSWEGEISPLLETSVKAVQLEGAQQSMSDAEFIDYCKEFLTQNTNFGCRVIYSLALAETQCKAGEVDEGQQMAKQVVNLCVADGYKQLALFNLLLAMNSCFELQFKNGWYSDSVETLEMMEEMAETSRQRIDASIHAPCLNSRSAVLAYMEASKEKRSLRSSLQKIKFCEKAISICKQHEKCVEYEGLYCAVINLLFEHALANGFEELGFSKLCKVFMDSPDNVRENPLVKLGVLRFFFSVYTSVIDRDDKFLLEELHTVLFSCRIMGEPYQFLCPLLFKIQQKFGRQLAEMYLKSLQIIHPKNQMRMPLRFGDELPDFGCFTLKPPDQFSEVISLLWKSLFIRGQATKETFQCFMAHVYEALCFSNFRYLNSTLQTVTKRYSRQTAFRRAFVDYCRSNFKSARWFWRIINSEKKGSSLQSISIVSMCNTIIWSLRSLGYRMCFDFVSLKCSVVPHEVCKFWLDFKELQ